MMMKIKSSHAAIKKTMQKRKPYRNKKITQSAKGEDCTLQFPGCRNDTGTTVFCHLNEGFAGKGMGQKADDCAGFYGCGHCHDIYDGRKPINPDSPLTEPNDYQDDWMVLRAYYRTIRRLIDKGIL